MKLSTKGRYGLRAMVDLVVHSREEPVSIASIAARQCISERYLEQLTAKLKRAGLVTSVRGVNGDISPAGRQKRSRWGMCFGLWRGIWTRWTVRDLGRRKDATGRMHA